MSNADTKRTVRKRKTCELQKSAEAQILSGPAEEVQILSGLLEGRIACVDEIGALRLVESIGPKALPNAACYQPGADQEYEKRKRQQVIGGSSCPFGHPLRAFKTTARNGITCDSCQERMPKRANMHGCRKCDFDLCGTCHLAPNRPIAPACVSPPDLHLPEHPTRSIHAFCQALNRTRWPMPSSAQRSPAISCLAS